MGNYRRRKIIVDPKLQYSLVSSFLFLFVLASAIYHATMSFVFLEVHAIAETLQLAPEHPIFSDFERLEHVAELAFGAIFLGSAVLSICAGLILSRRIAGPIAALSRQLGRVAEGVSDADVSFRKNDYFSELQAMFNRHMDVYRKQLAAVRDDME